ncbi:response regulator [Inhella sp.]|uniref:response regulator n=1 Tax=Inhella sp. TaxID=1921806 RepID=UPI0035AE86C3
MNPVDEANDGQALSTLDVARQLGMAVRSVQLMVDRGELQAWRTPGGHRRISRASVEAWLSQRQTGAPGAAAVEIARGNKTAAPRKLLYIEDSRHFQNLVSLLLRQRHPEVELHLADDGFAGLAMAGQLQPDVLLIDILLPGMDGATLIASLRSQPAFAKSRLVVLTSLEPADLVPYAFALEGLPVVHKPRLVQDLPGVLAAALAPA